MASSSSDFPPLPSSSVLGPSPAGLSYAANVSASSSSPAPFPMSFYSPGKKLSFKADDLSEGKTIWTSTLIGYSLGPRPYYERLLKAMQNLWPLKGSTTLLSLADGFFLLKFSMVEDLEMVLSGGPWFLLGKPFILQRWSPRFKPKRDEDAPIPIWIKIVDFPLVLWTPTGISKISSYIGIPISVDALTANRTRLTYARVCVLITKDSALPDEIPLEIDGEDLVLNVIYDWKPEKCEGCGSIIHPYSLCPKNPNPHPILPPQPPRNRGRSSSRPHYTRPHRSPSKKPPTKINNAVITIPTPALPPTPSLPFQPSATQSDAVQFVDTHTIPTSHPVLIPPTSCLVTSLANQPSSSRQPPVTDPLPSSANASPLPNLNSPTEETSSSGLPASPRLLQPPKIPLLNKFASLQTEEHTSHDTSESFSETDTNSGFIAEKDQSSIQRLLNNVEQNHHNTRSTADKGKSPSKSKPPKGKSAKKAKAHNF
ncbi:putative uncharacterized protein DDB_G0290521 [Dendrobium catenatum]|uniref:putative uncharacterized protein DDB_G0290521 n=1 Tax=Dendrobium catenatum TaxID=906689 RepID=UPI0009F23D31|nr:putative uncharacterized protein DDB_G0290521 [Dendrobium catenatum]